MIFTCNSFKSIAKIQSNVRTGMTRTQSSVPYEYPKELFFTAYEAIRRVWVGRESQRNVADSMGVSRNTLKEWDQAFETFGAIGLLQMPSTIEVDKRLEKLVVLVKTARPHAGNRSILTLAEALRIPEATLELISSVQRSHGYGQRLNENDVVWFGRLQRILLSIDKSRSTAITRSLSHGRSNRAGTFLDYDKDHFQHRIELFKALSLVGKKREILYVLERFGVHSSRFYKLREHYISYGIRGLVDITTYQRSGEKISPELELKILEERLTDPSLSTRKMIKSLKLKCSQSNIQKIYTRWRLSEIDTAVYIRGIPASEVPESSGRSIRTTVQSARSMFPTLIKSANLRVTNSFLKILKMLSYRKLPVCNPGAILAAPFLEQLGIVEAIHTYGPESMRTMEITNDIIVNTLRIIAGFPTINRYMDNSDNSVAIGAGMMRRKVKSSFYRSMDEFDFHHLQNLRNDLSARSMELTVSEGKEIAVDYHCDPCDSRFPRDRGLSKSPDKNGDMTYAHRPHILWDSVTNSIINIAYCEGKSRGPTSLHSFLENNLFGIIDSGAISEIYADSEYTGEKQLIYLHVRSKLSVTMCLKQNPKIRKWKEETLRAGKWQPYGKEYRIASRDYVLAETGMSFRFVVKENMENKEVRCFGSTHVDWSPKKILNKYHIRWPVETGIKDLAENYFLNRPTGSTPEKVETHYYCVMIARTLVDYFRNVFCEPQWTKNEACESVLSTIRTTIFSSQNCELSLTDSGDLLLTYLDGDSLGIKSNLKKMLEGRKECGLNKVSWWGGRGVLINIEDRFRSQNGSQI